MASLKSFLSNHGVKQFILYAAAVVVPLAIGFVNNWSAAGAAGPVIALLLREIDHVFLQGVVSPSEALPAVPALPEPAPAEPVSVAPEAPVSPV